MAEMTTNELRRRWIDGKDIDELLATLAAPRIPENVAEQVKAAIQVEVARIQRDAASEGVEWAKATAEATQGAVRWAKVSAIGTGTAALVAIVVAFLK